MKEEQFSSSGEQTPRLYHDLADWYPLLTPVGDYVEEAGLYKRLFETYCGRPLASLLDLGSGGGHNAAHLKSTLNCVLVDISPEMLAISRRLNPDLEHIQGDMRTVRLNRVFDCVLAHDAVSYMLSVDDLSKAITTAFTHTAIGGAALFMPDFVSENFKPGTDTGGSDDGARALRYLEWLWDPDPNDTTYLMDMAILIRDENGEVEVIHDRHVMGLFSREVWLKQIADAGFKPLAIPFEHSSNADGSHEVYIGLRL